MAAILQRLITSCADNQLHLSHGAQPKPLPPHQENQKPSQFTAGDSILLSTSGDTLLWDNRRTPFLISTFLGEDKFICVRCFEIIDEYSAYACTRSGVFFLEQVITTSLNPAPKYHSTREAQNPFNLHTPVLNFSSILFSFNNIRQYSL